MDSPSRRTSTRACFGMPILRNAGGRVTEDMIRSLVISKQQMGTREIVVLHTDCGAQTFENEGFRQQASKELGLMLETKTSHLSRYPQALEDVALKSLYADSIQTMLLSQSCL